MKWLIQTTLLNTLPDKVKMSITIDVIRIKSNLKINQTLIFTEKSFFYRFLGFTRSRSYPPDDIDGFYQLVAGSYKGDRPINIIGIDKVHIECNVVDGSIVNGCKETILYSFALSSPLGHKIYKECRIKLLKNINKAVLSHNILFGG